MDIARVIARIAKYNKLLKIEEQLGNSEGLAPLVGALKKSGYEGKTMIGMDIAASNFFKNGKYDLDFKNPNTKEADWISSDYLLERYKVFIRDFPVVSREKVPLVLKEASVAVVAITVAQL